ncbi:MAG TPA: TonB-dependent receptor [Candidatus Binatia bacterium]|nr:TonB-dependent receptor [Candidatus Binatia bacterium]
MHPVCLLVMALLAGGQAFSQDAPPDLTTLGIEAVMNMEVTSVSKKPERLMDAAAAVQVITSEDIRRSGATTLPDLLRLVPGVQVSRVNSNTWAVGVRGFTSTLSRSLLVLIDGRSIYNPLFAGVYWDSQDLPMNDIERIEVIRGPGATLWGANAVNGVINIITRSAQATQGSYASLRGGNEDRAVATGRFGGKTAGGLAFRAYGKFSDRDAEFHASSNDYDGWNLGLAGFRADADPREKDHLTFEGGFYTGKVGHRAAVSTYTSPFFQIVEEDSDLSGGHLLGQWKHRLHEDSDTTLQVYLDRTSRAETTFSEDRNTLDVEFRHSLRLGDRNGLLWGAGYRLTSGDTESVPTIEISPQNRTDDLLSAFVQDEIRIVPSRWTLTLGSKFEHNDYSGFNAQPNVRLLFVPSPRHVLWSAVSRALRVPSRIESDLSLTALVDPSTPTYVRVTGTKDFQPERLTAFELGYRVQATDRLFVDLALFHNDYARLLSLEPGTPFTETNPPPTHDVIPYSFLNRMKADVQGAEIASEWRPAASVRLTGSYSFLDMNLQPYNNSLDTTTEAGTEGSSPRHLASLRSGFDLPWQLGVDATLRYVGRLKSQNVDAYTEMDLVVSRDLPLGFEVSLVGQNLLARHHAEFGGGSAAIEVERSLYGRLVRRW